MLFTNLLTAFYERMKYENNMCHVTLPYIGGVTEPISCLIRKTGVATHAKPHTTARSILVALWPNYKDHPQDKCGVVYQLTCQDCEASYIGKTERAVKQRLKEHLKDSSPVGHRMGYNKHKVGSQNIRIVDRDSRWFQRGVREAIQIRSRSPTLNRDRGRHNLPSVYNTIVTWPKSELMKVGGCQQKASHLRIELHPITNRFKYHFHDEYMCIILTSP